MEAVNVVPDALMVSGRWLALLEKAIEEDRRLKRICTPAGLASLFPSLRDAHAYSAEELEVDRAIAAEASKVVQGRSGDA